MSSWLAGASSSSLTVAEADGTPSVSGVSTILVSNTTLTDNTGGSVTIAMTPAGGANTALSNLAAVAVSAALTTGAGTAAALTATQSAAGASSKAGISATLTASAATAGITNVGAAAGGDITITSGAAAQKTSGDANGGDIVLTPGAGIGTGAYGILRPSADNVLALGSSAVRFTTVNASTGFSIWTAVSDAKSAAYLDASGLSVGPGGSDDVDCVLSRNAPGVFGVQYNNGTPGHLVIGSIAGTSVPSDGTPSPVLVKAGDANPRGTSGNAAGANTILGGGIGRRIFEIVLYSQGTMAGSTVTITLNGVAYVLTEGVAADWHSTVSNASTATSLAAAIDALDGVSAESNDTYVEITPAPGTYSLTMTKSAADAGMTATSGADGAIYVPSATFIKFGSDAGINYESASSDIGLARSSAGLVKVTDGGTGTGNIAASTAITAVGTAAANGYIRTGVYRRAWTNAEVTAFGAVLSGDLKVATLPAKTVVRNAYLVIDSQASGTTTLTASFGRTSAAYIDYIAASDAKVAANTVYGDVVGERGTNLTGYDLPSYTGTADVYVQFVATDVTKKLADVLGCTGQVYLLTETLP